MQSKKLRPWIVIDGFPRCNDWTYRLVIKNSEDLRSALMESGDGIRMYLGAYEIGRIEGVEGAFTCGVTAKSGNGILAVLDGIFNKEANITDEAMDEIIENGISLEDFLQIALSVSGGDVIITDDPKICMVLLQTGYVHVLALKDAVREDLRDQSTEENVLLIKFSVSSESIENMEFEELPLPKNKLWFVNDDYYQSEDYIKAIRIFEPASSEELRSLIKSHAIDPEIPCLRMYLGEYEIGAVSESAEEECFIVESSYNWCLSENIGERMNWLFGMMLGIPYENMDSLLGKELSVEEFIAVSMAKWYEVEITDSKERIWELLHSGYMTVCTVNDMLHLDIRCNPGLLERYKDDKRVILVKMSLDDVFYKPHEESEDVE